MNFEGDLTQSAGTECTTSAQLSGQIGIILAKLQHLLINQSAGLLAYLSVCQLYSNQSIAESFVVRVSAQRTEPSKRAIAMD